MTALMDPPKRIQESMPSLRVWLLSVCLVVGLLATATVGIIQRGPSTPQKQAVALCRHNIHPTDCAQRRLDARAKDGK